MPIMVLLYQALVVGTVFAGRLHSRRAATIAALCWSTTTLLLVFMPWLAIFQLCVIWGSYAIFVSKPGLELPREGHSRTLAAIAAAMLAASPFIPPLFGLTLLAGWGAWRSSSKHRADLPDIPLALVDESTPRWLAHYERACESPAETAFLRAMVRSHRLMPESGSLHARGLLLELQKPIGRYRADFVVDGLLVVKIDGAAYHGLPEAKARDARRDQDMRRMGLTVLRIPAKTVFRTPMLAVRQVASAKRKN